MCSGKALAIARAVAATAIIRALLVFIRALHRFSGVSRLPKNYAHAAGNARYALQDVVSAVSDAGRVRLTGAIIGCPAAPLT
jgi:hypothetical protein